MITSSCYDTTALNGFPKDKTAKTLRAAWAGGAVRAFTAQGLPSNALYLRPVQDAYLLEDIKSHYFENLPALKHPFVMVDDKTHRSSIYLDARTMMIEDKVNQGFIQRGGSRVDLNMLLSRVSLERLWLDGHQIEMRSLSSLPAVVFARWVSSTLAQRYMLDPREQETIEIICGYYYYNMFTNDADEEADKIVGYLSRHMGMHAERSYEVIEQIKGDIKGVGALCLLFAEITGSIRLKDFNAGHLYTALGMSYFGMIGKELTAIALEHPPTWMIMLGYAVEDSMYRKSVIGTMMDRGTLRQKSKDYVMALDQLVESRLF